MRIVKSISRIQPLQIDTVELEPNSAIPGIIGNAVNVVGTVLAEKVTLSRNANISMPDGTYRIEVVVAGAQGTGSFKIIDVDRNVVSGTVLTAATATAGLIAGVNVLVTDTTGTTAGHYAEFTVVGDQTYIIPGTILGRSTITKKYKPATDALIATMDRFTIAQSFQETDKTKTVLPNGYENNVSQVFTVPVIVYGQIREVVCRGINLTDNLKAKLGHIAWI